MITLPRSSTSKDFEKDQARLTRDIKHICGWIARRLLKEEANKEELSFTDSEVLETTKPDKTAETIETKPEEKKPATVTGEAGTQSVKSDPGRMSAAPKQEVKKEEKSKEVVGNHGNDTQINELISMGFKKEEAEKALKMASNNVNLGGDTELGDVNSSTIESKSLSLLFNFPPC